MYTEWLLSIANNVEFASLRQLKFYVSDLMLNLPSMNSDDRSYARALLRKMQWIIEDRQESPNAMQQRAPRSSAWHLLERHNSKTLLKQGASHEAGAFRSKNKTATAEFFNRSLAELTRETFRANH